MVTISLLFLLAGVIDTRPSPVITEVFVGGHGPYRFLVDTGAETSIIDSQLAAELQLRPAFRVEVITQHTSRLLPGAKLRTLRLAERTLPETEVLFGDVPEIPRIGGPLRGVLGLNAFSGLDFTLLPRSGRLEITAERPAGVVVPYQLVEGRIAVQARMGSETLTLLLDSGSSHVVLFHKPAAMKSTPPVSTAFTTLEGARRVVPTIWTADMFFTDELRVPMLPAAIVERKNTKAQGLLPASAFQQVHVDGGRRELVLVR